MSEDSRDKVLELLVTLTETCNRLKQKIQDLEKYTTGLGLALVEIGYLVTTLADQQQLPVGDALRKLLEKTHPIIQDLQHSGDN